MDPFVEGLKAYYGDRVTERPAAGGGRLVRISNVPFAMGTRSTDVLVQWMPDQQRAGARPRVYVAPGTTLPGGAQGRNVQPMTVEGEPWLTFSFNFPWRWGDEPWKLVAGALRRFLKDD